VRDLDRLRGLEKFADDPAFQTGFMAVKRANKEDLAREIAASCGISVSPDALFDVQIKRLHEYKRQHLNLLHILALYRRLLQEPAPDIVPRVFVFAAKAAPGYDIAKNIIRAINVIGARINADERIGGKLKVAFLPNYRVSLAEKIIPASDLSEQISTAGKEASGTGNMKLALNGSLTIGTLDGANVEIKEHVGDDNIFIFGLTADQVEERRRQGLGTRELVAASPMLQQVLDQVRSGVFSPTQPDLYRDLVDSLLDHDHFLVLSDFQAYSDAQGQVAERWKDQAAWRRSSIINTANMGWFSSDRAIREYAEDIWNVPVLKS